MRDWLNGEWSEPRELAHVRGLIGRVGIIPPRLQVVIYDQQLTIQLISYQTEDQITRAVSSLRQIDRGLASHVRLACPQTHTPRAFGSCQISV